jgi:Amt family ammonium transporter
MSICILCILLVPLTAAGLSLIHSGLGRAHSAAHSVVASLFAVSVAALVYFVCGFAWQGCAGHPAHFFLVAGKPWSWIAAEPFFFRAVEWNGSPSSLVACLQLFSVALAAVIPLGSGAGRWRLGAVCLSTALLAGWTYPLFAHWVWGGGWLAQLGANYGLGHGFVDVGGSGTIQAVGGLTALAVAWILGPRRGKFGHDGVPMAMPGHNTVLVLFACSLVWLGFLGLNSAGAILFAKIEPGRIVLVAANTSLAAAAAVLMAAWVTRSRFGKPDASICANGWVGGLVASSASCSAVTPLAAVATGLFAGILVTFAVDWFENRLAADDPGGAISVHAVGGIWGLLALGLFSSFPASVANVPYGIAPGTQATWAGQLLAQVVGVATLIGFVFPLTYGLNWVLNRFYPQRAAPEGEHHGMDLHELGASAYPDFVTNIEDFTQR